MRVVAFIAAGLLLAGSVLAQDEYEDFGPKPTGGEKTKKKYEADLADHKGNDDILVLPGLVANRNERRV